MSHSAGSLVAVLLLALGCQSDSKNRSDPTPIAAKDVDGVAPGAEPIRAAPAPGNVVARPPAEVVAPPVDVAKPPTNAKKTDRGVFYKVLIHGKGKDHPHATSQIKVRYTGWTTAGKMFDGSAVKEAVTIPLSRVIPGWTDGLQVMVVGDKTRFWIPEELAYAGRPGPPPGMLVFDVELLEIIASDLGDPAPLATGSGLARFPGGHMPSAHRLPPGVSGMPPPMTTPRDTVAPSP